MSLIIIIRFFRIELLKRPSLWKVDNININRIITLTVIKIFSFHCNIYSFVELILS